MRAVSIVAVVLFHAFPGRFPAGFVGVDVFFVISGYLIGGLIIDELASGHFTFTSFYARRIRRIFPSLVAVLLAVYLIGWLVLFSGELSELGKHVAGAALFISNFMLLGEAGYFDAASHTKLLLHLWSLAIEEQFYLVWPLVCFLAWRKRFNILAITGVVLIASFAINILSADTATAFYSPLSRFWELNAGTVVALLQRRGGRIPLLGRVVDLTLTEYRGTLRTLFTFLGVACIGAAFILPDIQTYPGWWAVLPVGGSALLIATGPDTWLHRQILSSRPFVFVGLISYPLYMWHWPLISFAWIIYGSVPPLLIKVLLVVASFVLAYATYAFIEKPIRFAPNFAFKMPALVGLVVLAGATGLVTMYRNGFEDRAAARLNRELEIDLRIPTEARMSDGSCERFLATTAHDGEVCLANSARPRLLFIGDSHSMAMFNAIYEKAIDVPAVLIAAHSDLWARPECQTALTSNQQRADTEACHYVIRDALDLIGRLESIQAVVIVPFGGNPFFTDRERVDALRAYAVQHGKQVVYVLSAPSFASPAACSPRTIDLFGYRLRVDTQANACRATRASVEDDNRSQRRFLQTMARDGARVHLYDPTPVFCDAEYCHQSDKQGVFFWISGHVNLKGSKKMLRDFLPWARKELSLADLG